jgi:hypothetical protein
MGVIRKNYWTTRSKGQTIPKADRAESASGRSARHANHNSAFSFRGLSEPGETEKTNLAR